MAVDPVNRDMLIGLPVATGDKVILRHCLTGQLLCLEPELKNTDFGTERVVTARTVLDVRRRNDLQKVHKVLTLPLGACLALLPHACKLAD